MTTPMLATLWQLARRELRLAWRRPAAGAVLRCFAGGALMAVGGLLVPGSNDGLVLLGMPNFHLYAWAAFAANSTSCGPADPICPAARPASRSV